MPNLGGIRDGKRPRFTNRAWGPERESRQSCDIHGATLRFMDSALWNTDLLTGLEREIEP
jgi:hypothetical protein